MDLVTKINSLSTAIFGHSETPRGSYLTFGPSRTVDGKIIRPVAEVVDAPSTSRATHRDFSVNSADVHHLGSIIISGDSADFIPARQRRRLVPMAIGIGLALVVGLILLRRERS